MEHQFEQENQTELILTFGVEIQTTGDLFMAIIFLPLKHRATDPQYRVAAVPYRPGYSL